VVFLFRSKKDDSILIRTNNEFSFFDFCEQNDLTIEVAHRVGEEIEKINGYVTGYFPELSMFSLKGVSGFDYVIPLKNVELITIINQ
jgi:hypothetical protein